MTTPDKAYRWWYRDPLTKIMFKGTFAKIGVKNLRWTNYASVTDKTPEERQHMLHDVLRIARKVQNRYAALQLDLTDATNCALAERYETAEVLTLDRRDFRAIGPLTTHTAFRLLPDHL